MSILVSSISSGACYLAATTLPAGGEGATVFGWEFVVLGASLALAIVLAGVTGVFRPRRVDGTLRLPPGRPLWPLAVVIGIGVVVNFGSGIFYFAVKQAALMGQARQAETATSTQPTIAIQPTVADYAVLSTVPAMIAFACLFVADRMLGRSTQLELGFTRRRFADGVAKGLLAAVMVMPAMFAVSFAAEMIYQRTGFNHPGEHDLLRVMNEAKSPVLRWCLIGGAVLAAPFFEEYLFRGYLQTFLRQAFIGWTSKSVPVFSEPMVQSGSSVPATESAGAIALPPPLEAGGSPPIPWPAPVFGTAMGWHPVLPLAPPRVVVPPPAGKRIWQTWAAIAITSLLFASIHVQPGPGGAWMVPLIFILSLFLGYAYERTGSLWTSITIHLVFNATSTIFFLASSHSG